MGRQAETMPMLHSTSNQMPELVMVSGLFLDGMVSGFSSEVGESGLGWWRTHMIYHKL